MKFLFANIVLLQLLAGVALTASAACAIAEDLSVCPRRIPKTILPNLVQIHDDVFSGGVPGSEEAFRELHKMGIQTIISVDACTPDVLSAGAHKMRYVHLPHGYDGISESRVLEIAKAIKDLPKPVYVHCHHGRHRSPAAASAACLSAGLISSKDALATLDLAGTGKNYLGLFESVKRVHFDPQRDWSKIEVEFRAIAPISPLVASMVSIEMHFAILEKSYLHKPQTGLSAEQNPSHNLLMLREFYAELQREDRALRDDRFKKYLEEGCRVISALETCEAAYPLSSQIAGNKSLDQSRTQFEGDAEGYKRRSELMAELRHNCEGCHQIYRDVPNLGSLNSKIGN